MATGKTKSKKATAKKATAKKATAKKATAKKTGEKERRLKAVEKIQRELVKSAHRMSGHLKFLYDNALEESREDDNGLRIWLNFAIEDLKTTRNALADLGLPLR